MLTDRTTTVRASVADVEFELMLCIALVVAVIFVFLRTFAATIIPSIAVPLSLVGTFAAMYALGFSLNNLTLMALTISTGFVVDDAIVMIENITRYVEQGEAPLAAALKGAEQIGFTIMSLTVSLIAVLIPLLFMGDITGRLFREFAVTLERDHPDLRRDLAHAHADAAYFPTLSLSAAIGYESTALSKLIEAPNKFWSAGPALTQNVFDGGERRAAVLQARAQYDAQAATYRQTVLSAFQSVEDQLSSLRIPSQELAQERQALLAAKHTVELSLVRYRNGVDSYVNLITAENAFLSARETELQVRLRQLTSSVTLINDLGGGWTTSQLGETERMAKHPKDPGKEPLIPADSAGPPTPNPPGMPAGEIEPDDFIKLNNEAVGPSG